MKRYTQYILLIFILFFHMKNMVAQDSLNMHKEGLWVSDSAGRYNDLWGYEANGREYIIFGSNWGTHFIDITDPSNPQEINSFAGKNENVTWRDFKVMDTYAYGVADGGGNSLQIFDLQYLPDSVVKVYDEDSLTQSAHSIFIDNGRAYLSGNRDITFQPLRVLDLSNPINPTLAADFDNSYFGGCSGCLHDTYVRNDTAYCSSGYSGLYIYDFSNLASPQYINEITIYTDKGYNHSSWMTEDRNFLVVADEVPNSLYLNLFDISDLDNIQEVDTFTSNPGARPHNPFITCNEIYVSYYYDGVQVFSLDDPSNVEKVAFYDTYPDNGTSYPDSYDGCWGVYPFLSSDVIAASDITYGLFLLKKDYDLYSTGLNKDTLYQDSLFTLNFEVTRKFNPGNEFSIILSDQDGLFANPTSLGTVSGDSSGSITGYIPQDLPVGWYRMKVTASAPAQREACYLDVYISSGTRKISGVGLASDSVCQLSTFEVSFTTEGDFFSDNMFYLLLSDSNQSFSNATIIGSLQSDTSGVVSGYISDKMTEGDYLIKITSTSPKMDAPDSLVLHVLSTPEVPAISRVDLLDGGGCITLTDTLPGQKYYFTFDSIFVAEAYANDQLCSNDSGTGLYCVVTENMYGCKSQACEYFDDPNGMENAFEPAIRLFPNPTERKVTIQTEYQQELKVVVLDPLGRTILAKTFKNNTAEIDLKDYKKGIYFVKVNNRTFKLIKQ